MKIGIITFHASFNYGSMLQAYALHKVLTDMGHNVEIINFRSEEQREMYHHPINLSSSEWSKTHMLLHYFIHFPNYLPQIKKWEKYNSFLNEYLVHTKEFHTVEDLKKFDFQYDYLVIGSDQIWNTKCRDFSEAYWGDFCNEKIKKIAYAPSMGKNPEALDINYIKNCLFNFKAISVREERAKRVLIDNNVSSNIYLTLDPTLLLKPSDYEAFAKEKPIIKGEYMFFYDPFVRPQYLNIALKIGKRFGYKIIVDRTYPLNAYKHDNDILFYIHVGPKEFLNLIRFSTLVVGHSFHSVLFSILFKKDFYAIDGDIDSRLNYILKSLCLEKRAVNFENPSINEKKHIDYWDSVYEKLDKLKEESFSFIINNLS